MMHRELTMNQMEAVVGGSVTMPTYKKTPKTNATENKTETSDNYSSQVWAQVKFFVSAAWNWISD